MCLFFHSFSPSLLSLTKMAPGVMALLCSGGNGRGSRGGSDQEVDSCASVEGMFPVLLVPHLPAGSCSEVCWSNWRTCLNFSRNSQTHLSCWWSCIFSLWSDRGSYLVLWLGCCPRDMAVSVEWPQRVYQQATPTSMYSTIGQWELLANFYTTIGWGRLGSAPRPCNLITLPILL